jgi:hypothetical protein
MNEIKEGECKCIWDATSTTRNGCCTRCGLWIMFCNDAINGDCIGVDMGEIGRSMRFNHRDGTLVCIKVCEYCSRPIKMNAYPDGIEWPDTDYNKAE